MELLLAVFVTALAAAGLATGLLLAGRPPQMSCAAHGCPEGGCHGPCPRHKGPLEEDDARG